MTETEQYDRLTELTAEYQRALRGRDKWQARVEAAKREIDQFVSPAAAPTPAPAPAAVPAPTSAPEPAPAPVA